MRGVVDPAIAFLVVLLIGIVAGLIFERALRPGWFSRDVANERRGMVTMCLIGMAGSFIGFHLTLLLGLFRTGVLAPFIGAMIGAVAILWIWRWIR
ncbi:MAG: GlsB/YeaQ/YmgE family stress response membrane protein [Pseudorhodoplanes sp.]|nr:GlsB/YeaQ/YmgE family stress response membrane protein [Pseudorhodoplanes sp.]GIK79187.1 MAG: hypothetical protein BroJett024_02920 [Alphaproteobacteria bacterium]